MTAVDGIKLGWYFIIKNNHDQELWNAIVSKISELKDLNEIK